MAPMTTHCHHYWQPPTEATVYSDASSSSSPPGQTRMDSRSGNVKSPPGHYSPSGDPTASVSHSHYSDHQHDSCWACGCCSCFCCSSVESRLWVQIFVSSWILKDSFVYLIEEHDGRKQTNESDQKTVIQFSALETKNKRLPGGSNPRPLG